MLSPSEDIKPEDLEGYYTVEDEWIPPLQHINPPFTSTFGPVLIEVDEESSACGYHNPPAVLAPNRVPDIRLFSPAPVHKVSHLGRS